MEIREDVRDLNDAEKKYLAIRAKRLGEAQRMLAAEAARYQELFEVITGSDPTLAIDTQRGKLVRIEQVES